MVQQFHIKNIYHTLVPGDMTLIHSGFDQIRCS